MKRLTLLFLVAVHIAAGQNRYELNNGWVCAAMGSVKTTGDKISAASYSVKGWMPATVPGTVLTSLLDNKKVPDPFYGMNNEKIPDIYKTGRDHYTYWFVKDFTEKAPQGNEQVWLQFRGVNYSCDIFLNGKKVNANRHYGMFLRQNYNVTRLLNSNGNNRLAVIVYPIDPVGNPNGGQGGDGTIARNVSHQYVAGWDWIQPMRDRNTGIWDKVYIEKTGAVNVKNPHLVTQVPGVRKPEGPQQPAQILASAELENASDKKRDGVLQYQIDGQTVKQNISIEPGEVKEVKLPVFQLNNPKLWWPAGYGPQHLYTVKFQFIENGAVSDEETVTAGVREIQTGWNAITRSKQVAVNGQKIFIKGGNWIISDAMLRFTDKRYDAEIRYHRDMNLNLIRVWGGALIERPEFFNACDRYGMLVMQDFWMSGDCNGRWVDPMKSEDQWTRRKYPNDHNLFLHSVADQVKMVRNHPSLAMWCGGNEITPPEDILVPMRDSILPALDGTRWFVDYSNSDEMSYNSLGGNGDGPYTIQPVSHFWEHRTFPFNSEVGSVGVGDYVSLQRFIPPANMQFPTHTPKKVDSVWEYHKYIGYDQYIAPYGRLFDIADWTRKAQLVNYDQYRALSEGFSNRMWDWYTGFIIWKTQNPWTAMRGQMYDYYLDPNACLFGLRKGSEPLHVMCNPVDGMVTIVNNTFEEQRNLMLSVHFYDMYGKDSFVTQVFTYIEPSSAKRILSVKELMTNLSKEKGVFLSLQLLDEKKQVISDNFYWYPDEIGNYTGVEALAPALLKTNAKQLGKGKIEVTLTNPPTNTVAFFNRVTLVDANKKERILPVFYSDNYFSIVPGGEKKITIDYESSAAPLIIVEGQNVRPQEIKVQ
ncbi:glycoside hydrolase family 2 protein [Niastella populi]|uniref:Glycosyl hydrolase n=1 Tax=Niastella populi TaxID=550983 RepID=A0A1V9F5Y3_9BACT|nr:glycoside hydrolase family 2 TIM barrel-domain containing protein [Niastella populi]OQP53661.1 glycosyl hydrolase [Niastella populi]